VETRLFFFLDVVDFWLLVFGVTVVKSLHSPADLFAAAVDALPPPPLMTYFFFDCNICDLGCFVAAAAAAAVCDRRGLVTRQLAGDWLAAAAASTVANPHAESSQSFLTSSVQSHFRCSVLSSSVMSEVIEYWPRATIPEGAISGFFVVLVCSSILGP